jgi:hypothetical protein
VRERIFRLELLSPYTNPAFLYGLVTGVRNLLPNVAQLHPVIQVDSPSQLDQIELAEESGSMAPTSDL